MKTKPQMKVDTRIRCNHCGLRTWMTDYSAFMNDHDRPDGRRCVAGKDKGKK
jgi:hypothetical protein